MAYQNVKVFFFVTNGILLLHIGIHKKGVTKKKAFIKRNTFTHTETPKSTEKQRHLDNAVACKVEIITVFEKETEAQHLILAKMMYRHRIEKLEQ